MRPPYLWQTFNLFLFPDCAQLFHFVISSLKSGRSSYLLDVIVGLLYPVISLQVGDV